MFSFYKRDKYQYKRRLQNSFLKYLHRIVRIRDSDVANIIIQQQIIVRRICFPKFTVDVCMDWLLFYWQKKLFLINIPRNHLPYKFVYSYIVQFVCVPSTRPVSWCPPSLIYDYH
jgi:hypothetical protein